MTGHLSEQLKCKNYYFIISISKAMDKSFFKLYVCHFKNRKTYLFCILGEFCLMDLLSFFFLFLFAILFLSLETIVLCFCWIVVAVFGDLLVYPCSFMFFCVTVSLEFSGLFEEIIVVQTLFWFFWVGNISKFLSVFFKFSWEKLQYYFKFAKLFSFLH